MKYETLEDFLGHDIELLSDPDLIHQVVQAYVDVLCEDGYMPVTDELAAYLIDSIMHHLLLMANCLTPEVLEQLKDQTGAERLDYLLDNLEPHLDHLYKFFHLDETENETIH